jgi:hypothetical protein
MFHEVFTAFDQAGFLQDTFQNQLSPIALGFGLPFQSPRQVMSFFADELVQCCQFPHLFTKRKSFF